MSEVNDSQSERAKLNPRRELFCRLYASDREFFGNGTQSYIEAYDIDINEKGAYASARTSAYELLTNPDIIARINELLEESGLNDVNIDKQLAFLANQYADFGAKLGAIKEYNALKTRIQNKIDLNLKTPLTNIKFVFEEDGEEEDNNKPETETGSPDSN